jgi:hypothetical protein
MLWSYLCAVILAVATAPVRGGIPRKINYQGRLVDASTGMALAGEREIIFRVYDQPSDGAMLWTESQTVTADSAGIVSAILGTVAPINISFDREVWLEIEVDGEILLPRREVVSVPYAFRALDADSLDGLSSDAFSLVGHSHEEYVTVGEAASITAVMIADGEITDDDISGDAGIDPGKISGTAWTSANDGPGSGLDADMLDGLNADAFADSGHIHDSRYWQKEELQTPGTLNTAGNPMDWTKLKGVPSDFADGTDDVGGAGDGHSLDAADGSPVDVVYVNNQGKVGVGTTNPTLGKVEVSVSSGTGIYTASTAGTGILGWSSSGTGITGVSTTGRAADFVGNVYMSSRLGIGTDIPGVSLDVEGDISADSLYLIRDQRVLTASASHQTTILGIGAGADLIGRHNTFVGYEAGGNNTSSYNTFVGCKAGYGASMVSGNNTCVGAMTGGGIDHDEDNTFVGSHAGNAASGPGNTFLGSHAGGVATSSGGNTFLGANTGDSYQSGSHNTFVGYWAGAENQTGYRNVFLGYAAGYHEMGSDKLYISNGLDTTNTIIYGDFSSGRIGLGTLNPERKLHIRGNNPRILIDAYASNPEVNFKNAGDTASETWALYKDGGTDDLRFYQNFNRVTIESGTGNVGIGVEDPVYKLHVEGDIFCNGKLTSSGGNDPPYVLYNRETRYAIMDRVAREVPEDKLDGAVLFWNGDESRFEVYLPSAGEFRDITGNLLSEVTPTRSDG